MSKIKTIVEVGAGGSDEDAAAPVETVQTHNGDRSVCLRHALTIAVCFS